MIPAAYSGCRDLLPRIQGLSNLLLFHGYNATVGGWPDSAIDYIVFASPWLTRYMETLGTDQDISKLASVISELSALQTINMTLDHCRFFVYTAQWRGDCRWFCIC